MGYWGWKPYVPVAARRRKAEAAAAKAKKAGATLSPVAPSRGAIAKTFWGKAWCDNLERYSDFANRLPRGRTYVRGGSVIDLAIGKGEVRAQVMGSHLYRVEVRVASVKERHWKAIGADCAGSIDSMVELLQGTFSKAVMQRLCRPGDGLFPTPKEIEFTCSCPDWASMCKHVAAVLYGVGARLDQRPELLFQLRRVDGNDLLARAGTGLTRPGKALTKTRVLDESALAEVFGIEMAEVATRRHSVRPPSESEAKVRTTAKVPSARAAITAKTPTGNRRRGTKQAIFRQVIGATRKTQAAPAAVAVKKRAKRKPKP
ncbi:MAG TPA: SWIM zinc finger family protein [Casimicrobiaceae bacterium]